MNMTTPGPSAVPPPSPSSSSPARNDERHFTQWADAMAWQRIVDAELRDLGLTHTQYWVLATVAALEEQLRNLPNVHLVALWSRLTAPTASKVIAKLALAGLVDKGLADAVPFSWRLHVSCAGHERLALARARLRVAASRYRRELIDAGQARAAAIARYLCDSEDF